MFDMTHTRHAKLNIRFMNIPETFMLLNYVTLRSWSDVFLWLCRFPNYWPLRRGKSPVTTGESMRRWEYKGWVMRNVDSRCCKPGQIVQYTDELPGIWDAMTLISRHCNVISPVYSTVECYIYPATEYRLQRNPGPINKSRTESKILDDRDLLVKSNDALLWVYMLDDWGSALCMKSTCVYTEANWCDTVSNVAKCGLYSKYTSKYYYAL